MSVAPVHLAHSVGHIIAPLALVLTSVTENDFSTRETSADIVSLQHVAAGERLLAVSLVLVVGPLAVIVCFVAEHKLSFAVAHTVLEIALVVLAGVMLIVGELALAVRDSVSGLADKASFRKQYFQIAGNILVLRVHLESAFDTQAVSACSVLLADHTIHISSTHLSPQTVSDFALRATRQPVNLVALFRRLLYITKFYGKFLPFR